MFKHAIVCPPSNTFAQGISTSGPGSPDIRKALTQHKAYCQALRECGLSVTVLDPDNRFPDSTFVEDTAVIIGQLAVLTRPGVASRMGEVEAIREHIQNELPRVEEIISPGTLDGGDVCEADGHFFIGISHRTNETGARQLAAFLAAAGYTASFVDICELKGILHLKSGIAHLGDKDLVVWDELAGFPEFQGYNLIRVPREEYYAANCVAVNERVLVADDFPSFQERIANAGYDPLVLDVSEFRKMDGGLSCLSLRF